MRSKLCLMLSSEERKKNGKSQLSNQLMESMEWEANKKKRKNIDLHHPYEINRKHRIMVFWLDNLTPYCCILQQQKSSVDWTEKLGYWTNYILFNHLSSIFKHIYKVSLFTKWAFILCHRINSILFFCPHWTNNCDNSAVVKGNDQNNKQIVSRIWDYTKLIKLCVEF